MTNEKLAELIGKEQATLAKLYERKEELDAKIKKSETKLKELETMNNSQKFGALSSMVSKSGLTVDDLFAALQSGDFLALQERMEQAAQSAEEAEQSNEETENNDFMGGGEE